MAMEAHWWSLLGYGFCTVETVEILKYRGRGVDLGEREFYGSLWVSMAKAFAVMSLWYILSKWAVWYVIWLISEEDCNWLEILDSEIWI